MDEKTFKDVLQTRYYKPLEHHRHRAFVNQNYHRRLEWGLIILSAATTILIAIQSFSDWLPLKIITAIISASVTALVTTMKTQKYQEKSSLHNKAANNLENEYYFYKANEGSYKEAENKEWLFATRLMAIENETNKSMPNMTVPQSHFSEKNNQVL